MRRSIGEFEVKDTDLAGRLGKLYTPHGVLETPALLPVIDIEKQELSVNEIKEMGFNAIITNAYLIMKRYGKDAKKVHELIGFDGIIMTDSGAYQLLRYGAIDTTNKEVIEFEKKIDSDIAVILDVPSGSAYDKKQAEWSVQETIRRAQEAINYIDPEKRVWTLPVQGGPYVDLVENSAKMSAKYANYYTLYALGSPTILLERYRYSELLQLIVAARKHLPRSKPLHLFGAGHPMIIPFAVALGVDMFDSASYILYARDNRYMTLTHTYRLEDLDYLPCSCPVCIKYTPQEMLEMPAPERVKLLAKHNLYMLKQAINEVKVAIREGRLWELLTEKSHAHPSLHDALKVILDNIDYLTQYSPHVKGDETHGIFIFGHIDHKHPKVVEHLRRLFNNYKPRKCTKLILVPVDPNTKPFTVSNIYKLAKRRYRGAHLVGYVPALSLIPEELAETYPLSQFEISKEIDERLIVETIKIIKDYIAKFHSNCYSETIILYSSKIAWSKTIANRLSRELNIKVEKID
ncbi:MAG TPA: tRNA guanosine(15) transglycosylase TgtA [Pyrodictium sp.]|nr:tRNA guanosine(15) transglycosylase TgtA [Pyrodictium sp.]